MKKLKFQNGRVVDADTTTRCPDCDGHVIDEWAFCLHCGVEL